VTQNSDRAKYLAAKGYVVQVSKEDVADGVYLYLAINPEFEGCMAQGDSPEEAVANLEEVRTAYIEHLLDHNLPVPSPFTTVTSSGTSVPANSNPVVEISAANLGAMKNLQPDARTDDREILYEAWAKA
jgi:predicted RNase H-like HicB family nuclease